MKKKFLYKVYSPAGVFIRAWKDVVSEPSFSSEINGSFSELNVSLARSVSNFGENDDVKYGNIVRVFVSDGDTGQGTVQIYSGMISSYQPIIDGASEKIDITLVSWWWEANRYMLEGTGSGIDSLIYGNGYTQDLVPVLAGYTSGAITVSASSELTPPTYAAWKAFDNNFSEASGTCWASNSVVPAWLKVDFGVGVTKQVQKYAIIPNATDQAPMTWTFEGSNDNSTWTVLDTQSNQQDWGATEKRAFAFTNDTLFRYYRINVTAVNGSTLVGIKEFEMMESAAYSRVGATSVKYLSQDPSNILKDILDKFSALGGKLDYSAGTVDLTGTTVSYQFNTAMVQEALKKIIELCPQDWFLRVGADDFVYLKPKNSGVDHKFYIGRNVSYYKQEKRLENIVNYIYFTGKNFFKKYSNSGSVAAYGRFTQKMSDERVTNVATADIMANTVLNKMASPEIRITLRVTDNNSGNGRGYDIESIKVGDTCKIFNATSRAENLWDGIMWDLDAWDYDITNTAGTTLQIQKITYKPDFVELEISNRQPDLSKRIEDINRNLVDSITLTNPVIPQ